MWWRSYPYPEMIESCAKILEETRNWLHGWFKFVHSRQICCGSGGCDSRRKLVFGRGQKGKTQKATVVQTLFFHTGLNYPGGPEPSADFLADYTISGSFFELKTPETGPILRGLLTKPIFNGTDHHERQLEHEIHQNTSYHQQVYAGLFHTIK